MPGRRFRIFSRQVKESAVRRILAGEKIRTVAAELRVRPQLLYTWRDYYEQGGADALVPRGRPRKAVAAARRRALLQEPSPQARSIDTQAVRRGTRVWWSSSGRSASRRWSSIFSKQPCGTSRRHPGRTAGVAPERLRAHPRDDAPARRPRHRTDVRADRRQTGELLPALAPRGARTGTNRAAGCPPAPGDRSSSLRLPSPYRTAAPRRLGRKP